MDVNYMQANQLSPEETELQYYQEYEQQQAALQQSYGMHSFRRSYGQSQPNYGLYLSATPGQCKRVESTIS